jgi:hypothetical protein
VSRHNSTKAIAAREKQPATIPLELGIARVAGDRDFPQSLLLQFASIDGICGLAYGGFAIWILGRLPRNDLNIDSLE